MQGFFISYIQYAYLVVQVVLQILQHWHNVINEKTPETPIVQYIIFSQTPSIGMLLQITVTKLKSKNPTKPQFIAPTAVSMLNIKLSNFILNRLRTRGLKYEV